MRHWVIVVALAGCGGKQSTTTEAQEAAGPSCAQVGVHAAPMFHGDDATTDRIAASVTGHCEVDRWSGAARACAMEASNHDALHACSYKHLTREQTDKLAASITPLVQPRETPEATTSEPSYTPATTGGGSQAEIAARNAQEGQELFAQGKFAEASSKYMDAVARVPESRYFYLLGQSKYREGKFGEAMIAVDAAEKNNPNAALAVKIRELRSLITNEAKSQGIKL